MIIKKVKENWINEFTNHLDKAESKEFRKIRKYYQEQYFEGVDLFLKKRQTTGFDRLFQPNQLVDAFSDIYSNIGLSFALWYSKNFERLIKRQDVSNYNDTWQATFAAEGKRIAAKRVTLVQGTAKATLTKELTRFMRNPEFMSLNEREASRILRSRFNQYSDFQAKRLVRTEATNAANLGVMRSALDMFGADSLEKEWIAALDERVRSAHGATIKNVAFNEKFSVGGELLDRPGDPAGSPKNVINCRCSVAPFPKEDAEAISEIDSLEFDIAQQAFDPSSFGLTSRTVAPVVAEAITIAAEASSIKEAKQMFKDLFGEVGVSIKRTTVKKTNTLNDFNDKMKEFKRLMNKYKTNPLREGSEISFRLTGTRGAYGKVEYYVDSNRLPVNRKGKVTAVDFGETFEKMHPYYKESIIKSRTSKLDSDGFEIRGKSKVDLDNIHLSTVTHETAHFIDISDASGNPEFFKKMQELYNNYLSEIKDYKIKGDIKKYNEVFLGRYASSELDEFFAEGFTEFELSSSPSKFARLIGELTLKYYKR